MATPTTTTRRQRHDDSGDGDGGGTDNDATDDPPTTTRKTIYHLNCFVGDADSLRAADRDSRKSETVEANVWIVSYTCGDCSAHKSMAA